MSEITTPEAVEVVKGHAGTRETETTRATGAARLDLRISELTARDIEALAPVLSLFDGDTPPSATALISASPAIARALAQLGRVEEATLLDMPVADLLSLLARHVPAYIEENRTYLARELPDAVSLLSATLVGLTGTADPRPE